MADPTLTAARAAADVRAALIAENEYLQAELAECRREVLRLRLVLALARLATTARPLPPLRVVPVRIPAPRVSPEGLPRATSPRPLRRRPR